MTDKEKIDKLLDLLTYIVTELVLEPDHKKISEMFDVINSKLREIGH